THGHALSLHDALPIYRTEIRCPRQDGKRQAAQGPHQGRTPHTKTEAETMKRMPPDRGIRFLPDSNDVINHQRHKPDRDTEPGPRSEEHTSALQSRENL